MDTWPDSGFVGDEEEMADDEVAEFEDVRVKAETAKAILCVIDGDEHWVPKSQIDDESEVYDKSPDGRGPGKLIVNVWIAAQLGLV